jgi:hypothetical protein
MRITSYNITDVNYHYIGLRVIAGLPATARREEQVTTISHNILKYVQDKSLRLMLPEPRGTFETVGEKVCQELVHFRFAQSLKGAYVLTDDGQHALSLLNQKQYRELRHLMIRIHLQTYDNLRAIFQKHMEVGCIYRPIVESAFLNQDSYIPTLLNPTFGNEAQRVSEDVLVKLARKSPKKIEDALQERIIQFFFPEERINVALFRSLCDRLASLRLLNMRKVSHQGGEFTKNYSPCSMTTPLHKWHIPLLIPLIGDETFSFYFSEPNFQDEETLNVFSQSINEAFTNLIPQGGYYDVPEIRDVVCEKLKIPESSFDEGMSQLLKKESIPFTTGLRYDGISARRKPLVRPGETVQIYNLIRRI